MKFETAGKRMQYVRKERNKMTQLDLSIKTDIPKSTLAGYENDNREINFENLKKIAEVLNTSSDYIIGITDDPSPFKPNNDLLVMLESDNYNINGEKLSNDDKEFLLQMIRRLNLNWF